jgi:hypothetical protein
VLVASTTSMRARGTAWRKSVSEPKYGASTKNQRGPRRPMK